MVRGKTICEVNLDIPQEKWKVFPLFIYLLNMRPLHLIFYPFDKYSLHDLTTTHKVLMEYKQEYYSYWFYSYWFPKNKYNETAA